MKKAVLVAFVFSVILIIPISVFAGSGHHGGGDHHGDHHGDHGGGWLLHDFFHFYLAPPYPYYEHRHYEHRRYREPICRPGYWQWEHDEYGRLMRYWVRGYCE